ncbi:MAG: bifunctional [glutamine synthetase] adenylyltransferase/[glutamine synthetase]-adenylyl-L-tyrosine phosphorylase [Beijerinckiaceae bacterium]
MPPSAADVSLPLRKRVITAPRLADSEQALQRVESFLRDAGAEVREIATEPSWRTLLCGIADHSPYLWQLIRSQPARFARLAAAAPETSLTTILARLQAACETACETHSESQTMRALRLAKQETALLVALADLGGAWDVAEVMQALTTAADHFVALALRFILRDLAAQGKLLWDYADPGAACGMAILALGKHGGGELNYSSDTDLLVIFDPGSSGFPPGAEPNSLAVRITRRLVKLLQERTADGYVLRVDLRLRPDPGSTGVAISLPAAFAYYEQLGQNWERAALIKARPIAGDHAVAAKFLGGLVPFIWRKYFDYAAIADIHAMKRQIHAVRGHAEITSAGHDVKLGRGGIREIEFFVQTQQLIYGGKRPRLRGRQTLAMLAELFREDFVTDAAWHDLMAAYVFLRRIEHRLQMIADEQTQRLPRDYEDLHRFALFCDYPDLAAFVAELTRHLENVAAHYARLFEHSPGLASTSGNLVFTGVADDPGTLETLGRLGFKRASLAAETVRGWHYGRRVAVRSERAREVLTELIPALIEAFAGSGDPDAALAAFDQALSHMKAAVELLSILKSNAHLRNLFADILGSAPRLAEIIIRRPHVLDEVMDRNFLGENLDDQGFDARLTELISTLEATEDFLDLTRDFKQEEAFLIGLRLFSGLITPTAAGEAFSALAGALLRATLAHVTAAFAETYGRIAGGRCIVLAMGKLGSREMTAASDLDLIIIYDFAEDRPESDGARSLHALPYYTRLAQRLVSALTVTTRRGRLYEVDMRLRPSGRQGPIATQLASFVAYQMKEAETWEHMALTRARVIAGDATLAREVVEARTRILRRRRGASLRHDVASMRRLIAQEKGEGKPGEGDPFDLKYGAGGLLDIEFVAQFLALQHAHDIEEIWDGTPSRQIAKAADFGLLTAEQAATLISAHQLFTSVTQVLYTLVDSATLPLGASEAVKHRLAAAVGLPGFPQLDRELAETRTSVRDIFKAIIG